MKNRRQKSVDSLNKNIPIRAVPTAPIPVHTAYAVPIGRVCMARNKSIMLRVRHTRNPVSQSAAVVPVFSFALPRQVVNPISKSPAMISIIQFMSPVFLLKSPTPHRKDTTYR